MRALIVIAHYFHPEENPRHSAVNAAKRTDRGNAVRRVIASWRHVFGATATLNIEKRAFEPVTGHIDGMAICVLTTKGRHLLDPEFCKANGVQLIDCAIENPRYLGFQATKIFAEARNHFDYFVFSEDDLLVCDPLFFDKYRWFGETFGYRRLLMPNRFEWNLKGPAVKTYIDGDIARIAYDGWSSKIADEEFLQARSLAREFHFRRARNPHSGMHVVNSEQLSYWMDQPHWADQDASFVGPLESAATLGVLKTFALYKAVGRSASFMDVEHLDHAFSGLSLPGARRDASAAKAADAQAKPSEEKSGA
jgi:hypothetical protein